MRVEVEFESLTAAEAESLRAAVGSPDLYRQSGLEFSSSLTGARVVLQRMANARPTLRVTTDRPVRDPFVELVIEVTWRGGKLARSYTLLFDPPQLRSVTTPAAISAPPAPNAPSVTREPASRGGAGVAGGTGLVPRITNNPDDIDMSELGANTPRGADARPPRNANAARRGPPPAGAPDAPALVADPYRVRPGDTLSEMAQRGPRPAGVSLDRLVVALYRANQDAFIDGNINKLRPGAELQAPTAAAIAEITDAEARQVIRAQSDDFNAYRNQLAGMPAERPAAPTRRASGRVEAAVEDRRQGAAQTPDKLTLSKPPSRAGEAASEAAGSPAAKDAASRVAELSKNVQDLNRLSTDIARSGAGTASAPTAKPATGTASAPGFKLPIERVGPPPSATTPAPAASRPAAPPATSLSVPPAASRPAAATPPAVPPVVASAAASRPMAPASAPASAPARAAPPPARPPVTEPSVMDSLLDDNLPAVGLAGALIALLAAFGVFKLVQRRRATPPETSFLESRLKPDSFFGGSGGQRIDTREVGSTGTSSSMMNYSLSQLDAIGDVDPVAEADVYLAYGRDLQAEEILKEAMRTTPDRLAIRTKLLEVYAKRRDVKGYEQLALALQAITGGSGDEWAKACEMGLQIDPDNPLYGGSGVRDADSRAAAEDDAQGLSTLPQPMAADTRGGPTSEPPLSSSFDLDLDLDLGADDLPSPPQSTVPLSTGLPPPAPVAPPPLRSPSVFPPDALGKPTPPPGAPYVPPAEDMLNFTAPSGFGDLPPAPRAAPSPQPSVFPPGQGAPAKPTVDPAPFSASAFSLDLDLPPPSQLSAAPSMLPPIEGYGAAQPATNLDPDSDFDTSDPLVRKMELADEFRQIGDIEGARDLLQEVVDRAEGAVKAKAAAMLAGLS